MSTWEATGDVVVMTQPGETTDGKTGPSPYIPYPRSTLLTRTWDASLVPLLSALTVIFSYDNFQGALRGQEFVTGAIQVAIFVLYIVLKLIDFPAYRAKIVMYKQYGDTAVIVIMAYVLLLDINLSYVWLAMFPVSVIYALPLYMEFCTTGERGELAADYSGSTTKGSERFFSALAELFMPFGALLVMAQLDDKAAKRFVISQFLVFLSTSLGAVTYMMMSPPSCSQRLAPGSDLLHKAFLILLLVTSHTVAAEALGEQVIQACMPELVPVLLWFSVHLDRNRPVISIDKVTKLGKVILVIVVPVGGPLLAYVAYSKDEYFLSWCTGIMMSSGVSGVLTCYIVFMLRQWPRRQQAAADSSEQIVQSKQVAGGSLQETVKSTEQQSTGSTEKTAQTENQSAATSEGTLQSQGAAGSLDETLPSKEIAIGSSHRAAHYKEQEAACSSKEAVLLLEIWAVLLLTVGAALLLVIKPLDPKLYVFKNRWTIYTQ